MGKKYPNLLSGRGGGGWGKNWLGLVCSMVEERRHRCDVKHNFFDGKSWEKHTQEGVKPL